jgi:hypothetical protein
MSSKQEHGAKWVRSSKQKHGANWVWSSKQAHGANALGLHKRLEPVGFDQTLHDKTLLIRVELALVCPLDAILNPQQLFLVLDELVLVPDLSDQAMARVC